MPLTLPVTTDTSSAPKLPKLRPALAAACHAIQHNSIKDLSDQQRSPQDSQTRRVSQKGWSTQQSTVKSQPQPYR